MCCFVEATQAGVYNSVYTVGVAVNPDLLTGGWFKEHAQQSQHLRVLQNGLRVPQAGCGFHRSFIRHDIRQRTTLGNDIRKRPEVGAWARGLGLGDARVELVVRPRGPKDLYINIPYMTVATHGAKISVVGRF